MAAGGGILFDSGRRLQLVRNYILKRLISDCASCIPPFALAAACARLRLLFSGYMYCNTMSVGPDESFAKFL